MSCSNFGYAAASSNWRLRGGPMSASSVNPMPITTTTPKAIHRTIRTVARSTLVPIISIFIPMSACLDAVQRSVTSRTSRHQIATRGDIDFGHGDIHEEPPLSLHSADENEGRIPANASPVLGSARTRMRFCGDTLPFAAACMAGSGLTAPDVPETRSFGGLTRASSAGRHGERRFNLAGS